MAEPFIGMKYGTYDTLCEQNSKYYMRFKSSINESTFGEHKIRDIMDIWVNPKDWTQDLIGHKIVDRMGIHNPYNEGSLEVLYETESGELVKMEHRGYKRNEEGDIIFNYIYGDKNYAKDHNENGIVDEGEINSFDSLW